MSPLWCIWFIMSNKKRKLTLICLLHYVKLSYRSVLFVLALVVYIIARSSGSGEIFAGYEDEYWLLGLIWIVFAVEMAGRFFPSKTESMGCQRQFARNYIPTGEQKPVLQSWKRTLAVALIWIGLNGIIGVLWYTGVFDVGILILISLAYSVCDMICILFFCPFQTWIMKNRCCTVCRIYNWDFAMMFTPLVFIPNFFALSLFGMSVILLLRWELSFHIHPERFSDNTNACVSCKNCKEKLCHHKTQLKSFWEKNKSRFKFK